MTDQKTPEPGGKKTMIVRLPKDDDYGKIAIEYYDPASVQVPAGGVQPDEWVKEGPTVWSVNCGCGGGNCSC